MNNHDEAVEAAAIVLSGLTKDQWGMVHLSTINNSDPRDKYRIDAAGAIDAYLSTHAAGDELAFGVLVATLGYPQGHYSFDEVERQRKEAAQAITTLKARVAEGENNLRLANDLFDKSRGYYMEQKARAEAAEASAEKMQEAIEAAIKELADQGPELVLVIPMVLKQLRTALNPRDTDTPDTRQDSAADG